MTFRERLQKFWKLFTSGEIQLLATSLSFNTVLTIIPFLAVTLALIQQLGGMEGLYPQIKKLILQFFQSPLGEESAEYTRKLLNRVSIRKLGLLGVIGLSITSLFLLQSVEKALHRIWGVQKARPLFKRIGMYWFLLFSFPLLLSLYVATTSLQMVKSLLPPFGLACISLSILSFGIYVLLPNTRIQYGWAFIGSSISGVGMAMVTSGFNWFSKKILVTNKIYGSLAAFPTLLLWVLAMWYCVLLGAAIASFSHKRQSD